MVSPVPDPEKGMLPTVWPQDADEASRSVNAPHRHANRETSPLTMARARASAEPSQFPGACSLDRPACGRSGVSAPESLGMFASPSAEVRGTLRYKQK